MANANNTVFEVGPEAVVPGLDMILDPSKNEGIPIGNMLRVGLSVAGLIGGGAFVAHGAGIHLDGSTTALAAGGGSYDSGGPSNENSPQTPKPVPSSESTQYNLAKNSSTEANDPLLKSIFTFKLGGSRRLTPVGKGNCWSTAVSIGLTEDTKKNNVPRGKISFYVTNYSVYQFLPKQEQLKPVVSTTGAKLVRRPAVTRIVGCTEKGNTSILSRQATINVGSSLNKKKSEYFIPHQNFEFRGKLKIVKWAKTGDFKV